MKKLLFFVLLLASFAAAAVVPTVQYRYDPAGSWFDSKQAACSGIAAAHTAIVSSCARWPPNTSGSWSGTYSVKTMPTETSDTCVLDLNRTYCLNGAAIPPTTATYAVAYTKSECPSGSTAQEGSCVSNCPAAGTDTGNITLTTGWRTGPAAGAAYQTNYPSPYTTSPELCDGSCSKSLEEVVDCNVKQVAEGGYYRETCTYGTASTGESCTAATNPEAGKSAPTEPPPEPNRCPRGSVQTGIDPDGIPKCAGNSPAPEPPKTTTTQTTSGTDAGGNPTTTTTTSKTNSDGSTTTTTSTTTTNANGSSTTRTESATGSAPTGVAGRPDVQGSEFCKANPNLAVCKNSAVTGTCGEVSCEGDAIQCALLRTQAERNCRDKETEDAIAASGLYAKGNGAANGNDPDSNSLPSKEKATAVAVPAFDSSGWLGGGACFPDKTFSVQGKSITLSFVAACQPLLVFRYVLMIISLLISFRMFSGTLLKD
jgi:hypothetical protein